MDLPEYELPVLRRGAYVRVPGLLEGARWIST